MKTRLNFLLSLVVVLTAASCSDAYEITYTPPVTISFDGVTDGIATVAQGATTYTATIRVKASAGVSYFEIYNADARTGNKGAAVEGTSVFLSPAVQEYSTQFVVTGLTENRCIRISASDVNGATAEKNLVVKITSTVLFSEPVTIESADDYYGSYYAGWLDGRVYLASNGAQYASEIDLSFGMINDGRSLKPALVSPAGRSDYHLPTFAGLQETTFAETTLTMAQYNAISRVDPSPIAQLSDPTLRALTVANQKVYLFKTANGKKGLVAITGLTNRTGTIRDENGEWIKDSPYARIGISTKTIAR
jgi:hypothetical protein